MKTLLPLLTAILLLPALAHADKPYMGFSNWPSDLTQEAVDRTYDFLDQYADITLQQLDSGVPWPEALDSKPYHKNIMNDWADRKAKTPKDHKLMIAISPLNMGRDGLAPYWSSKSDSDQLPKAWRKKGYNDDDVKTAYANHAIAVADFFKPDYLALALEGNVVLSKTPEKMEEFAKLYAHAYQTVKAKYPDMKVFTTIQYEHLRGIDNDAKPTLQYQRDFVKSLMWFSDILALSTYKFGTVYPNPVKNDYFKEALSFGKPVAISETGATSKDVNAFGLHLPSNPQDQKQFMEMILSQAHKHDFEFVINWAAIDYDPMVKKLPKNMADFASFWMYTGLETSGGQKKPAFDVWQKYLNQ